MSTEDDHSWDHTEEPHSSFGVWVLLLTMCGVAVLAVVIYDVPYVDDFIEDIDVGGFVESVDFDGFKEKISVDAFMQRFKSAEPTNNAAQVFEDESESEEQIDEVAPTPRQRRHHEREREEEEIVERPPYEGPRSVYIEEGFDPDRVEFDFQAGGGEDANLPRLLNDDQIQTVVNRHQDELLDCYADELQYDPDITGRVDFDFAVHPNGRVAMVRVAGSTLRSNYAEDCFVERARHWRFPEIRQELPTRFETDFSFSH